MTLLQILENIDQELNQKESYLTELDRKIGDSDHGRNMTRGWGLGIDAVKQKDITTVSAIMKTLGMTLLNKIGGASGPLYGMSFYKASQVVDKEITAFDHQNFKDFVLETTKNLKSLGKAVIGDKTMVDVWEPFSKDVSSNLSKQTLLENLQKYSQATEVMLARKGRASFLGSRSVGTVDPGSASTEIILRHLVMGIY